MRPSHLYGNSLLGCMTMQIPKHGTGFHLNLAAKAMNYCNPLPVRCLALSKAPFLEPSTLLLRRKDKFSGSSCLLILPPLELPLWGKRVPGIQTDTVEDTQPASFFKVLVPNLEGRFVRKYNNQRAIQGSETLPSSSGTTCLTPKLLSKLLSTSESWLPA